MSVVNSEHSGGDKAQENAPISAEVLAAIAAAAAVFVGRRLRIRSIEQMNLTTGSADRWSRQGRALVQASHNLTVRH